MNIRDFLCENSKTNVQFVISAADLKEFAHGLIEEAAKTRKEADAPLYTPADFAARHGISKPTLWRWCKAGIMHPVRRGGKVYYRDSDLKGGGENDRTDSR